MKKVVVFASLMLLLASGAFSQSLPYNKATTVQVMRDNNVLLGQINAAASKSDYQGTAEKLMLMAQGMAKLIPMTAPRGDDAQWKDMVKTFLDAVYKAIGACGAKDQAALSAAIRDIKALSGSGHSSFR